MPRSYLLVMPALALAMSAAHAAPKKAEPADPNKIRCKSQLETGSLVKRIKTCRTEAEWRRISEVGRKDTQDIQTTVGGQGPQ